MNQVLFINPGWEQLPLLNRLSSNDSIELYAITARGVSGVGKHFFKETAEFDFEEIPAILAFAQRNAIDCVISDQCDFSLFVQAIMSDIMALPGPTPAAAYLSNNKYLQRLKAEKHGILIPKYSLIYCSSDAEVFANLIGYPVIIKPADNRGSYGVTKVSKPDDIDSAFLSALSHSRSKLVLVEEYINGTQFSVEGYSRPNCRHKTLAIGEKDMLSHDSQVAIGISYPANLPDGLYDKLASLNTDVNTKLGYEFGFTHTEYMLKDNEFFLIESSNRGGGCLTSELILPTVAGIDLLAQYISDCLGHDQDFISSPTEPGRRPVTLRFFSAEPGIFNGISNWSQLSHSNKCITSKLNLEPGDEVPDVVSDASRHGFFIVDGNKQDAINLISSLQFSHD